MLFRSVVNPLQRETGINIANLPKGPFGARLGYLMAAQSLIPHAVQAQARQRKLKQQNLRSETAQKRRKAKRKAFENERKYQRQTFESDRDYQARINKDKRSVFESDRGYLTGLQQQLQKQNQPLIKMRQTQDLEKNIVTEEPIDVNRMMRKKKYEFAQGLKKRVRNKEITRKQAIARMKAEGYSGY